MTDYICTECADGTPCILPDKEGGKPPTRCPFYDGTAEDFKVKWREVDATNKQALCDFRDAVTEAAE